MACARLLTPSFEQMVEMWCSTVSFETNRLLAISGLERPAVISSSTSSLSARQTGRVASRLLCRSTGDSVDSQLSQT